MISRKTNVGLGRLMLMYLPGELIPPLFGLLAIPVLTRLWTQDQYGYFVLAQITVLVCVQTCFSWVSSCSLRFYRPLENRPGTYFLNLLLGMIATSLVIFGIVAIAWPFLPERYQNLALLVGPLVVLVASSFTLSQCLRAQGRALSFSLTKGLESFFRYGPPIFVLVLVSGTINAFVATWTGGIALLVLLLIYLTGARRALERKAWDWSVIGQFARYGIPIMLIGTLATIISSLDRYVIDISRNASEVAIYGVSHQLGMFPVAIVTQLTLLVVLPVAVDAFEAKEDYERIARRGLRLFLLPAIGFMAVVSAMAPDILRVLTRPEYVEGAWAMRLVMVGGLLLGLAHYYRLPFLIHRQTGKLIYISLPAALFHVILLLFLVSRYGYFGAAVSTPCSYAVMLVVSVLMSRRIASIRFPFHVLFICLGGAAAVCGAYWALRQVWDIRSFFLLVTTAAILMMVYFVVLLISGEIQNEVRSLKNLLIKHVGDPFRRGPD